MLHIQETEFPPWIQFGRPAVSRADEEAKVRELAVLD